MLGAAADTASSVASVVEAYRAHGVFKRWPITYLPTHGGEGVVQDAKHLAVAAREFAALLAQHRRLAVHVHVRGSFWREAPFMAAALATGSPLIIQLHGSGFHPGIRWFLERAAIVCAPCDFTRNWVRSVARSADVAVTPPPVALDVPQAATKPNLVLFLGRLDAAKGIYDLMDAVAGVRSVVPDVRLVCAGEGDREALARYAERLGIAEAVKFTGRVGPSGKRALLEHAAVFALPSYEEGLPVSLVEAMSAGVPVVASSVGGIPEVVVDGASGYLIGAGDKRTLERMLRRLLTERALAARIGAAARETARLRFGAEAALAPLEDLYESLGVRASAERAARLAPVELKKAA